MDLTLIPTMIVTTTALSVLTLFLPLVQKLNMPTEKMIMISFTISLIPTTLTLNYHPLSTSIGLTLMRVSTLNLPLDSTMDANSNLFLSTALFATWAIMQFSTWYMKGSPKAKTFKKYLTMFLIAMVILIFADTMFQLFIGWEGIGVMSFLLINWWCGRPHANSAAMQAMAYNRVGDIGIVLALAWLATTQSTWKIQDIDPKANTTLLAFGLILAAAGKSAQFFMHLWLPSAMEGPTPVSALLHSSTMVVAGIYLLIKMYPVIQNHSTALTTCLHLGTATSLYASLTALHQNDLKKIIALSTLSQLGLMLTAIGLHHPQLAFMHILTHAATKAALFLCAGSFIHTLKNEQDIRKMGNMNSPQPATASCLVIASLVLMGAPFLSCFHSKDPIIETTITSKMSLWIAIAVLVSATLTSMYTMRMIYYTLMNCSPDKSPPPLSEVFNQSNPPIRLATLAILLGSVLTSTLVKTYTDPLMETQTKLTPTLTMLTGTLIAAIMLKPQTRTNKQKHTLYPALNQLAFFKITHRWVPKATLTMGAVIVTQLLDLFWLKKTGPETTSLLNKNASKLTSPLTGQIKTYLILTAIALAWALIVTDNS